MRPAQLLRARLIEAGVPLASVDRLALTDLDLSRHDGPALRIEQAARDVIAGGGMSYDMAKKFAVLLSGGTGAHHMQAVTRAFRVARAKIDVDALVDDLVAIHVTGGAAGEAARKRIAAHLTPAVRKLQKKEA